MISVFRKASVLSLCIVSFFLFAPGKAFACHVEDSAFTDTYRNNLNEDLNDYARILADADSNDRRCAELADYALYNKLNATPTTVWNQWLEGGVASVAFAAANRIGANGFATQDLDLALKRIHDNWTVLGRDAGCTKESVNQCVDDFAVAAPGYAWMAAYYSRRGDPYSDVGTLQQNAINAIGDAFNEVCIQKFEGSGSYCNGTAADLENPVAARTNSFNHGQRMPSYGYGLMTSMTNAALGLQASGYSSAIFTADQQKIARGLAKEMQIYTENNEFVYDCETSLFPDANGNFGFAYCGGPDNYSAKMYEQKEAYDAYFGGMPTGTFQGDTNSFDATKFDLESWEGGFFSWGRYIYYYTQSYEWVTSTREYLPVDNNNPIGWVDSINASGVVSGWTCDQDAPLHSNRVDLYASGNPNPVAFAYATDGSEPAVNSLCGGGSAHRFHAQLPSSAHGTTITPYGLDYTWYGFTQLGCSNCYYP